MALVIHVNDTYIYTLKLLFEVFISGTVVCQKIMDTAEYINIYRSVVCQKITGNAVW